MRAGFLALALALLAPAAALAQDQQPAPAYLDNEALDRFFDALKAAPDPVSARIASAEIWYIWTHPLDPDLAARFDEALAARQQADYEATLTILDDIVARWPGYAEGWNQRATIYYMLGDFERSLADVAKVLALEPRHFGALSGGAIIQLSLGNRPAALEFMIAAMRYHPFLSEVRLFPELLRPRVEV